MKIETQPRDDHQVKITAEFETEALEQFKRRAARKISKETKIPGFRPGKAPYDIVRRMYGDEAIAQEAVELMVDDVYPKILDEANIKPAAAGSLEEVVSMDPPTFTFIVPLEPTVDLGDYRSIRMDYTPAPLEEVEIDEFIERLQNNFATAEPVERPVQEGDLVYATINAELVSPTEGENATVYKDLPVQSMVKPVDKQATDEYPYPGFSWELLGLEGNGTKSIVYTYPEDAANERLRGKEVKFDISVQSVKSVALPELNDEFAQSVGEFENMDALRQVVRTQLEENAREEYDREYYADLIDKISEQAIIKYPPQTLEDEVKHLLSNLEQDLAEQKLDLETYLKLRNTNSEKFIEEEIKPVAVKRLKRSLIMDEIAKVEKIEVKNDEVQAEFSQAISEIGNAEDFKKISKKMTPNQIANAVAMEAITRLMNRRVLEKVKAIATGHGDDQEEIASETSGETELVLPEAESEEPGNPE